MHAAPVISTSSRTFTALIVVINRNIINLNLDCSCRRLACTEEPNRQPLVIILGSNAILLLIILILHNCLIAIDSKKQPVCAPRTSECTDSTFIRFKRLAFNERIVEFEDVFLSGDGVG